MEDYCSRRRCIIDIVLISDVRRPRLLTQTINTLSRNHSEGVNIHMEMSHGRGVGETKNAGAAAIKRRSDYVLFSDDDMYWLWDFDGCMKHIMDHTNIAQLGAWSHPFNAVTEIVDGPGAFMHGHVHAAHGGGFLMWWEDWDRYGPFDATGKGPGKSEDWALSQKIIKAGGIVRCIKPFVALHCGITNCEGKPATGAKELEEQIQQQIHDGKLKDVYYE